MLYSSSFNHSFMHQTFKHLLCAKCTVLDIEIGSEQTAQISAFMILIF